MISYHKLESFGSSFRESPFFQFSSVFPSQKDFSLFEFFHVLNRFFFFKNKVFTFHFVVNCSFKSRLDQRKKAQVLVWLGEDGSTSSAVRSAGFRQACERPPATRLQRCSCATECRWWCSATSPSWLCGATPLICDGQGVSTCNRLRASCQMDGKDKACRRLKLRLRWLSVIVWWGRTERPHKIREMLLVSQANARCNWHKTGQRQSTTNTQVSRCNAQPTQNWEIPTARRGAKNILRKSHKLDWNMVWTRYNKARRFSDYGVHGEPVDEPRTVPDAANDSHTRQPRADEKQDAISAGYKAKVSKSVNFTSDISFHHWTSKITGISGTQESGKQLPELIVFWKNPVGKDVGIHGSWNHGLCRPWIQVTVVQWDEAAVLRRLGVVMRSMNSQIGFSRARGWNDTPPRQQRGTM